MIVLGFSLALLHRREGCSPPGGGGLAWQLSQIITGAFDCGKKLRPLPGPLKPHSNALTIQVAYCDHRFMHHTTHTHRRKELTFLDAESQRSLVNLLPEDFARQIQNLWTSEEFGFLLSVSELTLRRELRRRDKTPSAVDDNIRLRFWFEFNRVQDEESQKPKMDMHAILAREISKEVFYRYYITDPFKLAWLLCPPTNYKALCEQALTLSVHKLIEIIETPHLQGETGYVHTDLVDRIVRIFESLHYKVNGQQVQPKVGRPRKKVDGEDASENSEPVESVEEQLRRIAEEIETRKASKVTMPEGDGT